MLTLAERLPFLDSMNEYGKLRSHPVWNYFEKINQIPRCSGNESEVMDFIKKDAASAWCAGQPGFEIISDAAGNVIIRKPAQGTESSDYVCIQAHTDMVCEKNSDCSHDFLKDPIRMYIDGEFVKADGTSLGADNGAGAAVMMALLHDQEAVHPPLELLFTVDEERNLTGARELDAKSLKSRRMINTDTEEDGVFYIGCAGGGDVEVRLPFTHTDTDTGHHTGLRLHVRGLHGGHSGFDIHRGRANAVKIMAGLISSVIDLNPYVVHIEGGDKRNAIPRECHAEIMFPDGTDITAAEDQIKKTFQNYKKIHKLTDPDLNLGTEEAEFRGVTVFHSDFSRKLISLLLSMHHGVFNYSGIMHGLVESSNNVASVHKKEDHILIILSVRSSAGEDILNHYRKLLSSAAELHGARCTWGPSYPAWIPDLGSPLLKTASEVYEKKYGSRPKAKAVHAGLETGVIGGSVPGMDMISMGPEINFPHSPQERIHIASTEKFYEFIKEFLKAL